MAAEPEILKVQSIKKYFGGLKAVDGVDLNVPQGELRAIIGPNGAGKTTLFNLITGHLKPDSGSVTFHGDDIFAKPAYALCRMGLARTFQITSVFLDLTAFENVQTAWFARHGKISNFVSKAKGISTDDVMSILESVGLEEQASRQAKVLP
jgi:branched-chain amino acid transport system ATP-binding protein